MISMLLLNLILSICSKDQINNMMSIILFASLLQGCREFVNYREGGQHSALAPRLVGVVICMIGL